MHVGLNCISDSGPEENVYASAKEETIRKDSQIKENS